MNIDELNQQLQDAENKLKDAEATEEFERILKEYKGEDEVISFQKYRELTGEEKKGGIGKSGIPCLDDLIGEFSEGDLVVITAPTGQGKTTLAQTITRNLSRKEVRSLWFSYEVPERQLIEKFGEELPDGYLPRVLIDRNLTWIERKIVEGIAKFQTRVVFIDHLHYLIPMKEMRQPSLEIGQVVRNLKLIAKKYNIAIFLIAHLTKTKFDEAITLDDIRDSSFIAQEADFVITMQRSLAKQSLKERREEGVVFLNDATLSVAKNRRTGRLGNKKVGLVNGFFVELAYGTNEQNN